MTIVATIIKANNALTEQELANYLEIIYQQNSSDMEQTISTEPLSDNAVDIIISNHNGGFNISQIQQILEQYISNHNLQTDIIIQDLAMRSKKLLLSDMDSTIINQECIDELADYCGIKPKIAEITERAMNGELDFTEALNERVGLLADLSITTLDDCYRNNISLMAGAKTLIQTANAQGILCVLVSGGFTFFTEQIAKDCGFSYNHANELEIDTQKNILTGKVLPPILDKHTKEKFLQYYCNQLQITTHQAIAIGDGANDLPMLLAAGLGIAYHAKPNVSAQAHHKIKYNDLSAILYALGIKKKDWVMGS